MATSTITSAGAGSGYDFESIISASVEAKKSTLENRTNVKRGLAELEVSGVSKLKSALSTFQDSLKALTEKNSMNAHKVTTTESKDVDIFDIETEEDATNVNFSLSVTQLAASEKVVQKFTGSNGQEFNNSFKAGTLEIDLGKDEDGKERKFTVNVEEGDSLELIRKRINQNDYGVTASLIKTKEGYSFSIDGGQTGENSTSLTITAKDAQGADASNNSLSAFAFTQGSSGSWSHTKGLDAKVLVDGQEVSSKSNTFDDGQIAGVKLTVKRLSENETISTTNPDGSINTVTGLKSYQVDIGSDEDAVTKKMQTFIDSYNTLMSTMDKLYAHNTYTDGQNNYDGGDLAGDSQLSTIKNQIQSMVSNFSSNVSGKTIYDCGIEFKSDGTLELDNTKFKDALENSYNSVVNLFTGDNGLLTKMQDFVKGYTETSGLLDQRTEELNLKLKDITAEENDNADYLTKYEESLRQRYANLDSLISGYNTSLSYITNLF